MDLRTDRVTVSVGELGGLCEVRGESILDGMGVSEVGNMGGEECVIGLLIAAGMESNVGLGPVVSKQEL